MKKLLLFVLLCSIGFTTNAQKLKMPKFKKKKNKVKTEIYECGYVGKSKKVTAADVIVKGTKLMSKLKRKKNKDNPKIKRGVNSSLGTAAITVTYQAHLHPLPIIKYPTETPGWETCGDAIWLGFTNRNGIGVTSPDGPVAITQEFAKNEEDKILEISNAGFGTYFHGFDPSLRAEEYVMVSTSNKDMIQVEVKPGEPLAIKSIDGKPKGESITIDGTKDIVIELENGDADPQSNLHVQLVSSLVGTDIIYDVVVTKAKNTITIPKDAFYNYEGSPSPFKKNNTLIINRVTETIIDDTKAGALRTLSAYMDWTPIFLEGDLTKGNALTMGFDEKKNTKIDIKLNTKGTYNFSVTKAGPFKAPPVKLAKNVAIGSFVVRGKLTEKTVKKVVVFDEDGKLRNATLTKNSALPKILNSTKTWFDLSNSMYTQLENQLKTKMGWNITPVKKLTSAKAYKHAKAVKNTSNNTLVEVGAYGTKRIITSSSDDLFKDLSITFPGDFVSQRLVKELDLDMVLAITIDLNMNAKTQSLDPEVHIVAFAPNVSYKTAAQYFTMKASALGVKFKEGEKFSGTAAEKVAEMIKSEAFIKEFIKAMKVLSEKEAEYPVYENLWKAKL